MTAQDPLYISGASVNLQHSTLVAQGDQHAVVAGVIGHAVGVRPVDVLVKPPHPPVRPERVIANTKWVQIIHGIPAPYDLSLGRKLHHRVGHHHRILPRRERIILGTDVVLDGIGVGGKAQKVAVRHLMRLMVQRLDAMDRDSVRVFRLWEGPLLCVVLVFHEAQHVYLDRGKIRTMHKDVAVVQSLYPGCSAVRLIPPDDLCMLVESHKHAPLR